jgi:NitT/TauT family transport system substrate-binding protein
VARAEESTLNRRGRDVRHSGTLLIALFVFLAACTAAPAGTPGAPGPTGTAAAGPPGDLEAVNLRLNWVIAGNHAPFFLAKEEGYWEECGLDVSLAAGQGSGDTAQLVANRTQQFGLTDAVSITAGRVRGLPVTGLGVVYQTNPTSIVSKKATGITEPADLEGKTFGAVPGGSAYLLGKALMAQNDVDVSTIREVTVPAPGIAQLLSDQVDFITFFGNEVANIDPNPEENLNVMWAKDYGQDIYGLTLATHPDYITENPDAVRCFLQGVRRGFAEAGNDREAALNALEAANPETAERREVHRLMLDGVFEFTGEDFLAQTLEKWTQTQQVLLDSGVIESTGDVQTFFTTEFDE